MFQSPAEKARETKLREDPLAIVLSPTYVECKRCGKQIKLSAKSAFDPLHWRTHRARCLKTRHTKTTIKSTEIKAQAPTLVFPLPSLSPRAWPLVHSHSIDSDGSTEPSSSPLPFVASTLPPLYQPSVATSECLRHPNPVSNTPPTQGWQSCTWVQSKGSTIDSTITHELENELFNPGPNETMEEKMHREAALSLSLLSRSP
ncbi:hypothetical protein K443DRAFT_671908 [Laccaria amethystina LaAM-08-1]|uniref:Uncharacterized protein n=1 Tax=Laccaria amethystina LaAM-08-1 TaxID=1095629 RepID=A0A0C9Y4F0_9AGAR|nr:hypothetical protein K443DRAFT_671908 [Laccaria amethystina LaAM-08-1]